MPVEVLQTGDGAPPLHAAVAALFEGANAYVTPLSLRSYQRDIALAGVFTIMDPRAGTAVQCVTSVYMEPKAFSYLFDGEGGRFWVITGSAARGYAIGAIYFEDQDQYLVDPEVCHVETVVASLAGLRGADRFSARGLKARSVRAVVGHPNFAHFAWNELPAIQTWAAVAGRRPLHLLAMSEPILPIEDLADVSDCQIERISESYVKRLDTAAAPTILFSFGSERVTTAVRERITRSCLLRRPEPGSAGTRETFCVWLSLRLLYRHAVNETEAFGVIISRLLSERADIVVMLDGYSLPYDLIYANRYDIRREQHFQSSVTAIAQDLIRSLDPAQRKRVIDLTGADLPAAIAAASVADFYICHHGTQQHKIGWLYSTPGIIHAGASILKTFPAGWVQSQAEGAVLPEYIPAELVGECESPDNPRQSMPYFADYKFVDLPALTEFVVDRVLAARTVWGR